jgi:cell division protease FtsH
MADENKKPEVKKPKFNAYWIYIGIFLLFIGIQFFGGSSWSQPT